MRDRLTRSLTAAAVAVLALIAAPALAACGGSASSAGSSSAPGGGAGPGRPPDSSDPTSAAPPSGAAAHNARSTGFGWVPFGPSDPGDPPPNRWYGPLADHNCGRLTQALQDEPGGALWTAVAAVCAAVIDGDQRQWTVAVSQAAAAADSGDGDSGSTGCLADAARALLARALAWHQDHPHTRPHVTLPRAGQQTACAFRITSITLVDADDNPVVGALSGPVTGGTHLAISGDGLGTSPTVLIAGHRAAVVSSEGSGGAIIVAAPAVSHPLVGRIRVGNEAGQLLAPVGFRYVAAPGTSS